MNTNPIKSSKPILTCLHYDSNIIANENENFNLTIKIVDKFTQIQIPNISWNVIQFIINLILNLIKLFLF